MELADVLIRVDVTKFSGTDYNNADKLISRGYEAALGGIPGQTRSPKNQISAGSFLYPGERDNT